MGEAMLSISHDQTHPQLAALQALCISFLHTRNSPVSTYWKGRKAGLAQCDSASLSIREL